jgi:DNA-binding protein YbaB
MGFLDQMKQLMELKQKMEATKEKLDQISVQASNKAVSVSANGNRKITSIQISGAVTGPELEKLLCEAVNEALAKADQIAQAELANHLPKIPGING